MIVQQHQSSSNVGDVSYYYGSLDQTFSFNYFMISLAGFFLVDFFAFELSQHDLSWFEKKKIWRFFWFLNF